ncbi:MAG: hypothetical protein WDM80_08860 [Limisphaerales bacterium]
MNIIRTKIIAFWLLFLLFCFLLWISWHHRLLWIAIFVPAWVIIGLIKPRPPRPSRQVALLFRIGLILMLVVVFMHALQPSSAGLLLLAKIVCGLFIVPRLCYQAYKDYDTFRSADCGRA